ncbi:MAG: cobalamin-dependent protein [Pyrinomonadaceae bacterium]
MSQVFPTISADVVLVHAPAFFDFRDRGDIYFPYLSTSGDVPITPLYEYFPLGFKTLQRFLGERGHDVKIINLSTVLLKFPGVDVAALLRAVDARLFGIDLHWMVHVQGSLRIAELLKSVHAEAPVIFGGISSTYYAEELIRYPFIDMVMRGYNTLEPMASLLGALKCGQSLDRVENLLWKDEGGRVVDNGLSYLPEAYSCGINWSSLPAESRTQTLPISEVLSTQNAGCSYNCGWCGGSREAFRRVYGLAPQSRAMSRKPAEEIAYEFASVAQIPDLNKYHFYSVGSYNEPKPAMKAFLRQVAETNFKSVSYEQFHLTPDDVLEEMAKANRRTFITLSPESHDMRVAKLAGRGVYSPEQMERWIERALDRGIYGIDVWYFIGMPEQDERSVRETVDYCHRLLKLFKGRRVTPLLCPMIPFLDPASSFFEFPERHGYRVFYRTVEEHRRGMERASLINRTNYETRWLDRKALTMVGYQAVKRLTQLKGETGFLPGGVADSVVRKIDDAMEFISVVHEVDCIANEAERAREIDKLSDEIKERNRSIFFGGVANQAFPINRQIGGRWFDEMLFDLPTLEAAHESGAAGGGIQP